MELEQLLATPSVLASGAEPWRGDCSVATLTEATSHLARLFLGPWFGKSTIQAIDSQLQDTAVTIIRDGLVGHQYEEWFGTPSRVWSRGARTGVARPALG